MHKWTWGSLREMGVMERLWDPLRVSGIFRDLSLPGQLLPGGSDAGPGRRHLKGSGSFSRSFSRPLLLT